MAELAAAPSSTKTTCPYCGVGCGVIATPEPDGRVRIEGDPDHPANFGRLCAKGASLGETLSLEDRLLEPMVGGKATTWDAALDLVARRFNQTISEYGPESVALYVSGQFLTEDYYVANKLMKGWIGTANIDTNSRLCMASSVAGHKRAFGTDTVPGTYQDLELADCLVLVGSNLAWCHPVLHQRVMAAKAKRPEMQIIVIDPRRTATAEMADRHLPIELGSDVALYAGLLAHMEAAGVLDHRFIAASTEGFTEALRAARSIGFEGALRETGLKAQELLAFYELCAKTQKLVTVYSQGVNQAVDGTDKVNAIINCHLATGRIGLPGAGPFSITGQPNAMGGREVGGLANQLAAHADLNNAVDRARVQAFWASPKIADQPGLKAVDLFHAIGEGKVKAVWIMATNPVDSLPNADAVAQALAACSFVVVSDVLTKTDTTAYAHVLLPATAWGEKDGTVTNSERRISRQRAFLPAPGQAKPDWSQLAEVAKRMFPEANAEATAFDYNSAADIFREHAQLSHAIGHNAKDFDIGGLSSLSDHEFNALEPVQWPQPLGAEPMAERRFFADGKFFTASGRANFVPTPLVARPRDHVRPLKLNTGRVRDHWHTMTRTGKTARLSAHIAEPYCEIHPVDAAAAKIRPASLVRVSSRHGEVIVRAWVTDRARKGSIFVPMHWTDQFSTHGRVDAVVSQAYDPYSGQPGLKLTDVEITPYKAAWYGFAVRRTQPERTLSQVTTFARADGGWRIELASETQPADWNTEARRILGLEAGDELTAYQDRAKGQHRFAAFRGGQFLGALFTAKEPVAVSRSWAVGLLEDSSPDPIRILAGRPGADRPDQGSIVCGCFQVGVNTIATAVASGQCRTLAEVGNQLKAGSNCGSCRPEIQRIIVQAQPRAVAAE